MYKTSLKVTIYLEQKNIEKYGLFSYIKINTYFHNNYII